MRFVLDNSVAMRWLFADGSHADQAYAEHVLDQLATDEVTAIAPSIWPLEVANVVARAEATDVLLEATSTEFLQLLEALGVSIDDDTAKHSLGATLQLARRYHLSAYDAAYLELALRASGPLATLDGALRTAAEQSGAGLVQM